MTGESGMAGPVWGVCAAVSRKEAPGFARFLAGAGKAPEAQGRGDCVGFAFGGLDEAAAKDLEREIMGYLGELPEGEWLAVETQKTVNRRGDGLSSFSACVELGGFPDCERGWA